MKSIKQTTLLISVLFLFSCGAQQNEELEEQQKCIDYVNPFIGTSNSDVIPTNLSPNFTNGNTYPGAVVPWGMASASPHNTYTPDKGNGYENKPAGFYYGNKYIFGFGHTHLSGVGCRDMGTFLTTPTTGEITPDLNKIKSTYSNQVAKPGYYKVDLTDKHITVELSATTRTTISKFTFRQPGDSVAILIDMFHNLTPADSASFTILSPTEIAGWNYTGGFCAQKIGRKTYFVAEFSKGAKSTGTYNKGEIKPGNSTENAPETGAYFSFDAKNNETILMKLGISYVSIENARLNLKNEQPDWNFNEVRKKAETDWEQQLQKIQVKGGSKAQKTVFYTALYHCLLHPNIFEDVNGEYIAMKNNKVKKLKEGQKHQYTVFSLWDTYRNLHQLLTLVYPEQQTDMLRSMVDHYYEGGFLPKWELAADETYVMVGDPACPVIADSYLKGIQGFNIDTAYHAMIKSSSKLQNKIRPGLDQYLKYGYIPEDNHGDSWVWGTVATSLEYYIADYAIAQIAKNLGHEKNYAIYYDRSQNYKKLFDENTGFMRPKNQDSTWYSPFNPDTIRGSMPGASFPNGGVGFVEGNAWQYTFFVPHDISGMIELMGEKRFLKKLKAAFEVPGRFELFNEPDIAYPFLFNYINGEEWRTQKQVRKALDKYFNDTPGGLPGNDDCGTMSAWAVFAMLGFYPDCPADTDYQLCSPVFDEAVIQLQQPYYKGKQFMIKTTNNQPRNLYIKSIHIDEKEYGKYFIPHEEIVNGGEIVIELEESHDDAQD